MSPRLRVAAILLFARGGWAGGVGLSFLAVAAIFWNHRSTGPNDSQLVDVVLTLSVAGGLTMLGAAGIAIAIPSLVFALLLMTRKRWARRAVVVGESLVAIALVAATVAVRADKSLAASIIVAIAVFSGPVIFLLVSPLATGKPADAR